MVIMFTTDPQSVIDLTILVGSGLGATGAALVPYWAKIRQNQELGLPPITFDKKFAGTLILALVVGFAVAFMSFSVTSAQIPANQSIIQVFVIAATTSAVSNRWLNSYLAVSPVTAQVVELRKDNEQLADELNVMKLKVASLRAPILNEVKDKDVATAKAVVAAVETNADGSVDTSQPTS
jgi:hypothetical protein